MSVVGGGIDIDGDQGFGGGGGGGVYKNDDKKKKQKKRFGFGYGCLCTENFRKAKKVVLFPFTKAKKQIFHRRNKRVSLSSSPAPASAANENGRFSGNTIKGCCFCFRQPNTLDSPCESHRSDPNDPSFSGEMLKLLIDKNDFYSKECNPHLD